MAHARRERTIAAAPQRVWEVVADPHHFPRWWPGVARMESVGPDAWTQVFMTKRGRPVRLDFRLLRSEPPWHRAWAQEIPGTPFARVLAESVTEVMLEPVEGGTHVVIEQRQRLKGYSRTGGVLLRRATAQKLTEALEGLERVLVS